MSDCLPGDWGERELPTRRLGERPGRGHNDTILKFPIHSLYNLLFIHSLYNLLFIHSLNNMLFIRQGTPKTDSCLLSDIMTLLTSERACAVVFDNTNPWYSCTLKLLLKLSVVQCPTTGRVAQWIMKTVQRFLAKGQLAVRLPVLWRLRGRTVMVPAGLMTV